MIDNPNFRQQISRAALCDESELLDRLVAESGIDESLWAEISAHTEALVKQLRSEGKATFLQAFLGEYGLSTEEGVALMSMTEAFLRVPDADTLDELISEKITGSNWQSHSGQAASFLVNASTWALMLTGRLLTEVQNAGLIQAMRELIRRFGEPVVRVAMTEAMEQMGNHFVVAETIGSALKRTGKDSRYRDYSFSFDMLGEVALTHADAEQYFDSYKTALMALATDSSGDIKSNSGISVKLSALHPRFELLRKSRSFELLLERMKQLARMAAAVPLNLNIDGEDAESLEYTLDIFEALAQSQEFEDWQGLGIVVQTYSRCAPRIIDWLDQLAKKHNRHFMVRLVKGAYWDTEIKRAQVLGLDSYPVFTRKHFTDIVYIATARSLLKSSPRLYPQFATHNAHSVSSILLMAKQLNVPTDQFEFQRLYGMGEDLHEATRVCHATSHRIYAPVGEHEDLLAYLVRRLLENGANSSFVHQSTDESVSPQLIAADPFARFEDDSGRSPGIGPPAAIYGSRLNSVGWDTANSAQLAEIDILREPWHEHRWQAAPLVVKKSVDREARQVINPACPEECVGFVEDIEQQDLATAITQAVEYATQWSAVLIEKRAELLRKTAQLIETHFGELLALLMRESGKTLDDAIGEWREAIDFLRYYADQALAWDKQDSRQARGVFACIAPWNFPLSIFTGQIAAALVTGNSVLAKPAEQATLIAYRITQIFHQAGVPLAALQLLPGEGESVGAELCKDARLGGICFTGSLEVAQSIRKSQAEFAEVGAALIAETGGINAMIVDSTALPEQTVQDIVSSAFSSTGQRCSALRIVYIQEDVADRFVEMLIGAMDSLFVGDPWQFESDLGPVIDDEAYNGLRAYIDSQELLHKIEVPAVGHYVSPVLIEVTGIADIEQEIFGPVLHVARFKVEELDKVIDQINLAGYGLTCSIQSRLTQRVDHCIEKLRIGNLYVNRNQIGAVVESQPFGGNGLSGTGPKAGGPLYLAAFTRSANVHSSSQLAGNSANIELDTLQRTIDELSIDDWEKCVDRRVLLQNVSPGSQALIDSDLLIKQQMPGPTGERNIYQLRSNACALCLGSTPTLALEQALQALVFGGAAVVCCEQDEATQQAVSAMQDLGIPIRWLVATPTLNAILKVRGIGSVSWCGDHAYGRQLMQALADRKGAILRLITEPLNPLAYLTECHVCNDITSSGGNVELMSSTDL